MTSRPEASIHVHVAGPGDLSDVEMLEHLWAREAITPNPYAPTGRDDLVRHGYLLVARNGDQIVGHLTADCLIEDGSTEYPMGLFPAGAGFIHVEGMYVMSEWRRHGVGGRLLRSLVEQARAKGIRRFRLTAVHWDMPPLVRFYMAHGFVCAGPPGRFGEQGMIREDLD